MVEGARLESVYTATYRGFESLLLRHLIKNASAREALLIRTLKKMDENHRFDQMLLREYLAMSLLSGEALSNIEQKHCVASYLFRLPIWRGWAAR